ncbi:MAG: hypothetical protein IID44_24300 [Planctomycetes bacterium]|nr:hypothetical protein [Planctomycetota bacterium]
MLRQRPGRPLRRLFAILRRLFLRFADLLETLLDFHLLANQLLHRSKQLRFIGGHFGNRISLQRFKADVLCRQPLPLSTGFQPRFVIRLASFRLPFANAEIDFYAVDIIRRVLWNLLASINITEHPQRRVTERLAGLGHDWLTRFAVHVPRETAVRFPFFELLAKPLTFRQRRPGIFDDRVGGIDDLILAFVDREFVLVDPLINRGTRRAGQRPPGGVDTL